MGRRVVWLAAVLSFALVLGVGSADGRSLAVSTVTVQVIGKGRVTSSPDGITCGDDERDCYVAFSGSGMITLEAKDTADGWSFDTWSSCPSGSAGDSCTFTIGADHDIIAEFSGPATGTSTLSVSAALVDTTVPPDGILDSGGKVDGGEIHCGSGGAGACSSTVLTGSTLTVLETPDTNFVFDGWSGACNGADVACTVELSGNESVGAVWSQSAAPKLLTVTISGNGTVKGGALDCTGPATCTASMPAGTVTLTAAPNNGYLFSGWGGVAGTTGDCTGTGATCTVTMDVARTAVATFTPAVQLTVAVTGNGNVSGGTGAINCGNGATICSANFAANSTVTLIATPATGATFTGWTGACGGTATTCTVAMSASRGASATFAGGAPPGTGTLVLSVTVTGNGIVSGGGIQCGSGGTVCTANQTPNATVTLVAAPSTEATFGGWGGACSGTTTTCTVTMTAAASVTATFSGGSPTSVQPSVNVTVAGRGSVRGGAITCGIGGTACLATVAPNTTITLTATPAAGETFTGWGGACAFARTTACTLTVTAPANVVATFSGATSGGGGATAGGALASSGRPLVKRTARGYAVTLRFKTQQAGTARVTGRRAGRLLTSLSVRVPAGSATIGPFPVAKPGFYTFEVRLGTRALRWRTCLGRCGSAAGAAPFRLLRDTPVVKRTGAAWSVTLRFRASAISDANISVRRGGKLLSAHHFLAGMRRIVVGPFLLGPGSYTFRLSAVDAFGRIRTLTWIADLAR